jgi:predicted phosphodiesterase
MKIALASDLHLEFQGIQLKNTEGAEVLILSGDICIAEDLHNHPRSDEKSLIKLGARQLAAKRYRDFFDQVSAEFPHVVYVAGNHEFYHGRWKASIQHLRDEFKDIPNIHFLEQDRWDHNGYTFLGSTLWTDLNKGDPVTMYSIHNMMNDYKVIRNDEKAFSKLHSASVVARHAKTLAWLKDQCYDIDNNIIIVGHHAPSPLSIHEHFKHDPVMNGGYMSDLSQVMLDNPHIKMWTHGHIHNPCTYHIGDTLVACNPRGYAGWDPNAETFKLRFFDLENMPENTGEVVWHRG